MKITATTTDASGRTVAIGIAALAIAALSGCANLPNPLRTVEVHQPLTARPAPIPVAAPGSGAIFQAVSYQPLFEDRRARLVGDTLIININEKLNASKTATTNADRKGTTAFSVPTAQIGSVAIKGGSISGQSDIKFNGSGDSGANNVFTGTITVTVIDVLANGNLLVSGEKQIGINTGSEFVRLSGVVNPTTILAGNVVSSSQVADARLEYRGTGAVDEANTMGWLARVFQSVLPF
jgi:flagellar L-ring protein FlgH